ncbi:PilC/PilY family type IV pilus protein [Oryzisolibacter sp. LB2S]|uniref:pilus assembly protein n=1 Tax=Alicycliphilus soli TaxID=3228789 RepID=UPI003457D2CC
MHCTTPPRFHKKLLCIAIGAALAPHGVWAVDLVQAPPGTVQPYVTPNVIISVDDSGSMNFRLDYESTQGASNTTSPSADGTWPTNSRRMNVLKYALKSIFDPTHPKYDSTLLPDKKIRLAWQTMWNNGKSPGVGTQWKSGNTTSHAGANSVDSSSLGENSMKVLEGAHRTNFLSFVSKLTPGGGTPSHQMLARADAYMRRTLNKNGPWASIPGDQETPYLGCRRNYHIFMTDGRWNGSASGGSQDNNTTNITLPDGTIYGSTNATNRPKSNLYSDTHSNTLADWAFKSWATPLQTAVDPNGVSGLKGNPQTTAEYNKAPVTEDFGKDSAGNDAKLDRFWNPRYNPATWPHMVTYTIGFSKMAFQWSYPQITAPTSMLPFGYDGSFPDLVNGKVSWPQLTTGTEDRNALDLWHAALNGRGRFYAVEKGEDLAKAFRDIFQQINTQVDPNLTSTATSGSNISRTDVGKFTGNYEPKNAWKGFVTAETVQKDGTTVPTTSWGGKNTADKLDAMDINSRLILSWSDEWVTSGEKGGVAFKWSNGQTYLSTAQKALLGKDPSDSTVTVATNAENRLNFIRGDQSKEGSETTGYTTSKPLRERKSRQGDIVNSVVWYTGAPASNYALKGYGAFTLARKSRTPMIYVGGNDGLLHGFSATDGTEQIAYAPRGVIASLPLLTDPSYNNKHKFFVDGSPMTGDVDLGGPDPSDPTTTIPDWRTVLVGTMGAGGKGYFVLDVTNPASSDAGTLPGFSEGNAQKLVVLDRTRGSEAAPNCAVMTGAQQTACNTTVAEDRDIGYITARPVLDETNPMRTTQITRMNNNRWAVVMGNGYNSANQRPVLLIQYLDGAKELKRLSAALADATGTGNANDNGLSSPRLVDLNGDNRADIAYAGDNLGNLWKFDLTNEDDTQWNVAFGGQPLFTATGPASLGSARTQVQRITSAPTVRANDRTMQVGTGTSAKTVSVGGMMVAFGTGRNVTKADESDAKVQTLYSVLDNTRYRTVTGTKGKRLEVHPGGGSCPAGPNCVPAPAALGKGVATAKLAMQSITAVGSDGHARVDATDELKKETWANYNGWYMDLPAVGERVLKPLEFYDGSNILAMYSQVPAKGSDADPNVESCESTTVDEERQYLTLVNIMDGKRPTVQLLDHDGNGMFYSQPPSQPPSGGCSSCGDDLLVTRMPVAKGSHTLIKKGGSGDCLNYDIDVKNNKIAMACMPEQSLRPSWRQLK